MITIKLCKITITAILILAVMEGCTTGKKPAKTIAKQAVPVTFSKDTSATRYTIKPAAGHTMIVENLQIYVSHNSQPGAGVAIKRLDNSKSNIILPHIVNGNTYVFGGIVNIKLNNGDDATIEVADIQTGQLLNARIIISGTEQ